MKPKLANRSAVNFVVCVRKPSPIAEVAIKNAAPTMTDLFFKIIVQKLVSKIITGYCFGNLFS